MNPANWALSTKNREISHRAGMRGGGCSRHEPVSAPQFPANREINREFCRIRPREAIFARRQPANSMVCSKIPYATEQGIFRAITGNFRQRTGNFRREMLDFEFGAVTAPCRVLGVRGPRPSVAARGTTLAFLRAALASRSASRLAARSASLLAARSASLLAERSASFFALFTSAGFLFVARALFALGRDAESPDTTSASGVSGRLGRRRVRFA